MTMDDWNVFFTAIGILYLVATLICAVLIITGSNSGRVEKRSFFIVLLSPIVVIVGLILIISSAIYFLRDVISDGGLILHYRKKKNKKKKREMYERVKAAYMNGEIKREDLPRVEDGKVTFEFKEEMGLAVDYYSKVREIVYIENGYCESLNRFFTEHRDLRL